MSIINQLFNRKISLKLSLFYVGFILCSISTLLGRSALFEFPDLLTEQILPIISATLFGAKFLLDKHTKKELPIYVIIIVVLIILKIFCSLNTYIVLSVLAFISFRQVNIDKVIKIDLAIKAFFLLSHALVFTVDYLTGIEETSNFIHYLTKGTSLSLYFVNPNTTGLLGTWIALDMLYLKKDKRFRDFVFPTVIVLITYFLTTSRTPFLVYIVYILLQFIRNDNHLMILQKTIYPFLSILSLLVMMFYNPNNSIFMIIDKALSGRLYYSSLAYNLIGINIIPRTDAALLLKNCVVDVFYVKCCVQFGITTLALYYIPHLLMPKNASKEEKRMSIVASIYLFFEWVIANIGFAPAYLILADAFYNHRGNEGVE